MPIQVMKRYSRKHLQDQPHKLFIFGDNSARVGLGGQAAEARGESNAIGVRTKKAPTYQEEDLFTDKEYSKNIELIFQDLGPVFLALQEGKIVVWPEDGIGTGIARLPENAPMTLSFINEVIDALKHIYGVIEL